MGDSDDSDAAPVALPSGGATRSDQSLVGVLLEVGETAAAAGDVCPPPLPVLKRLAAAAYLRRSCGAVAWAARKLGVKACIAGGFR
jgi:hypothetical protein